MKLAKLPTAALNTVLKKLSLKDVVALKQTSSKMDNLVPKKEFDHLARSEFVRRRNALRDTLVAYVDAWCNLIRDDALFHSDPRAHTSVLTQLHIGHGESAIRIDTSFMRSHADKPEQFYATCSVKIGEEEDMAHNFFHLLKPSCAQQWKAFVSFFFNTHVTAPTLLNHVALGVICSINFNMVCTKKEDAHWTYYGPNEVDGTLSQALTAMSADGFEGELGRRMGTVLKRMDALTRLHVVEGGRRKSKK